MSFWIFYVLAFIPVIIGGVLFIFNKKVHWGEWLAGSVVAYIAAGVMHVIAVKGMTDDIETWSGHIISSKHYAAWQEYYEEAIYKTKVYYTTDSKGRRHMHTKRVFSHWAPRQRWHSDSYSAYSNIATNYSITTQKFDYFVNKFANKKAVPGSRRTGSHNSRMIGGDPNDYETHNTTGWIEPVTKLVAFENKIKASPSLFSFAKVPETIKVYPYPANDNPWSSDRLLGSAALIDLMAFDQMNARLGPKKKINIIMVGMGNVDGSYSQWQEAAWLRGKKNDVTITWGGSNKAPTWVRVFSWGEGAALKNIESIILKSGASTEVLPAIEAELSKNFKHSDWTRFDYLTVEIRPVYIWGFIIGMIIIQGAFWFFAHNNDINKDYFRYV
jgi:hypothetical protein